MINCSDMKFDNPLSIFGGTVYLSGGATRPEAVSIIKYCIQNISKEGRGLIEDENYLTITYTIPSCTQYVPLDIILKRNSQAK